MLPTSARLLRLLSLLQAHRDWTGPELARRLEVSTRTIRNDVERLRELGYPVDATTGRTGGYRLGAGAALPPLLLDDDEAVAVAVGLRSAASGTVGGIEETSVRALAKLEQVLPSRLRHRVRTLAQAVVPVPGAGPTVAAEVLTAIATAIRDHQRLRFDYADHGGAVTRRDTEPHRLVHTGRRWYLVAWDLDRDDWRTFRVDRTIPRIPTGPRFVPREPPDPDIAGYVTRGAGAAMWQHRARVRLHAPAAAVAGRITPAMGTLTPLDDAHCEFRTGADTLPVLAVYLGFLDVDFDVLDPPELVAHLRALGERYLRAAAPTPVGWTGPSPPPP
ncbi:YafY family protein [Pseudonocardia sp. MH-G8]|uniref:helix-turn-helix transcriptional regulator n=1 Tax=Pseudonocardia sp. MH-G8 TaxID=1854588 RepID=UPI000BA03E81|nr:YafY family protein [Pseudonocardia sp. MH-G8]OZM79305.1 DNA-binding transcriptional regulator [Pseudonocardia sp. MH-G8]